MTYEPTRLESLEGSLDAEVKSVEILRGRLEAPRPRPNKKRKGEWGGDGGVKRATEVLDAYAAWLADPSKEFEIGAPERDTPREDDVSSPPATFRPRYN